MKKFRFIIGMACAILFSSAATAQIEKGKILIGARSDFNAFFGSSKYEMTSSGTTTESDGAKTTMFGFTPTVGYFFIDGLAGGIFMNVDVDNSKEDQEIEDGSTVNLKDNCSSFTVGPFVRYYVDMDKVKPFAHLQVGFGSNTYKYDYVDYDYSNPLNPTVQVVEEKTKYSLSTWGIGAGGAFFITDHISVDAMLIYNHQCSKYKDDDTDFEYKNKGGYFGLDVGFTVILP